VSVRDEEPLAPVAPPRASRRARLRAKPGIRHAYRAGVFLLGLCFIALGIALAVLPGPLTIPPVLFGLWIWSTEFQFAHALFETFKEKAHDAWAAAKRKPVTSAIITIGGLVGAGVAIWAVQRYELIDRARDAVGI
jgi:fatty acid desaturase